MVTESALAAAHCHTCTPAVIPVASSTVNTNGVCPPITKFSSHAAPSVLHSAVPETTKKWAVDGGPSGCAAAIEPIHTPVETPGIIDHQCLAGGGGGGAWWENCTLRLTRLRARCLGLELPL